MRCSGLRAEGPRVSVVVVIVVVCANALAGMAASASAIAELRTRFFIFGTPAIERFREITRWVRGSSGEADRTFDGESEDERD